MPEYLMSHYLQQQHPSAPSTTISAAPRTLDALLTHISTVKHDPMVIFRTTGEERTTAEADGVTGESGGRNNHRRKVKRSVKRLRQ